LGFKSALGKSAECILNPFAREKEGPKASISVAFCAKLAINYNLIMIISSSNDVIVVLTPLNSDA
jgi:hypothetical protein